LDSNKKWSFVSSQVTETEVEVEVEIEIEIEKLDLPFHAYYEQSRSDSQNISLDRLRRFSCSIGNRLDESV
jgi:hypothetical protein